MTSTISHTFPLIRLLPGLLHSRVLALKPCRLAGRSTSYLRPCAPGWLCCLKLFPTSPLFTSCSSYGPQLYSQYTSLARRKHFKSIVAFQETKVFCPSYFFPGATHTHFIALLQGEHSPQHQASQTSVSYYKYKLFSTIWY